jgi:hypothetical protein
LRFVAGTAGGLSALTTAGVGVALAGVLAAAKTGGFVAALLANARNSPGLLPPCCPTPSNP